MYKIKFIIILFITSVNSSLAQYNYLVQPDTNASENAVIWDLFPDDPRPNDILFQGSAWTLNGTPEIYRSLLRFELLSIPMNAIVDSAFITFFGYVNTFNGHSSLSGSNESLLQRITSAWTEGSVTWNTQPTRTSADEVYFPISTFPGEDYLNYNIKDIVQTWITNPSSNYGLFYALQTEQQYRRMSFHSPASNDSSKRPLLNIYYSLPSGLENSEEYYCKVYPNPSNGNFSISLQNMKNITVVIYNSLMQKIEFNAMFNSNDQITNVCFNRIPGIYIIEITDDKMNQIINKIIVK